MGCFGHRNVSIARVVQEVNPLRQDFLKKVRNSILVKSLAKYQRPGLYFFAAPGYT